MGLPGVLHTHPPTHPQNHPPTHPNTPGGGGRGGGGWFTELGLPPTLPIDSLLHALIPVGLQQSVMLLVPPVLSNCVGTIPDDQECEHLQKHRKESWLPLRGAECITVIPMPHPLFEKVLGTIGHTMH